MRTRTKSIVTAFVLLSLVSGAIGCRSNGGPWYNPKSYTWHNPLKSNEAPPFSSEDSAQVNSRPSMGALPDVNTPPGGYVNKEEEARFLSGRKDAAVVPQYGASQNGADVSRVASVGGTAAPQSVYPDSSGSNLGYAPYGGSSFGGNGVFPGTTEYQQTTLHTTDAASQAGVYPGSAVPGAGLPAASADPMVYPGNTYPSSTYPGSAYPGGMATPSPAEGYSPYGAPVQNPAPVGGPIGAPIYGNPGDPQGFPPMTAPGQPAEAAPMGAMPTNPGLTGYTAAPSAYPPAAPQGF